LQRIRRLPRQSAIPNVLKNVARRQWVFIIPRVLRKSFYKDRLLLGELARCAAATILDLCQ